MLPTTVLDTTRDFDRVFSLLRRRLEDMFNVWDHVGGDVGVRETSDRVVLEVTMPRADRDSLDVTFDENTRILTVKAKSKKYDDEWKWLQYPHDRITELEKRFTIPEKLEIEHADYVDGVVEIHLRKVETSKDVKKIPVKSGE